MRAPRWIPPIPNHFKINFDGAVFLELDAAGLGVVIFYSCGRVVGALAKRIPIPTTATIVEALACQRALIFAKELNLKDTMFEGDAEQIMKALLAKVVHQPKYEHVLQDSLVLASDFRVCMYTHVKRVSNFVAHFLARRSKSLQVWMGSILEDLAPFVSRDVL